MLIVPDKHCPNCNATYGVQNDGEFLCYDGIHNSFLETTCTHYICVYCIRKLTKQKEVQCPICCEDWTEWIHNAYPRCNCNGCISFEKTKRVPLTTKKAKPSQKKRKQQRLKKTRISNDGSSVLTSQLLDEQCPIAILDESEGYSIEEIQIAKDYIRMQERNFGI